MATVPSIKGSVFVSYVEDLRKLVSCEAISQSELERRLPPADLKVIEQPIHASAWYDIQMYARIVELLMDAEGDGRIEYLQERGAKSADRLLKAGLYQQLEYLGRTQLSKTSDPHERFLAFGRDLKLLNTIQATILNFSRLERKPDPDYPDRYILEVAEASAYPEVLCWTTLGFTNRMAEEHGSPDLWVWERPRPDLILYLMTRAV